MRKFVIDTDTGSDDAVALMMAVLSPEVEVLGLTTVCGNVPLDKATLNALMTLEVCGREELEVYPGLDRPMCREAVTAVNVHGDDGMGDLDLIHPKKAPASVHAVDYILEQARRYPGGAGAGDAGPGHQCGHRHPPGSGGHGGDQADLVHGHRGLWAGEHHPGGRVQCL